MVGLGSGPSGSLFGLVGKILVGLSVYRSGLVGLAEHARQHTAYAKHAAHLVSEAGHGAGL